MKSETINTITTEVRNMTQQTNSQVYVLTCRKKHIQFAHTNTKIALYTSPKMCEKNGNPIKRTNISEYCWSHATCTHSGKECCHKKWDI